MTRSRPSSPLIRARLQAGRGWALHVAMALVLLFAQTQASLHWLSHSTAAVQSAVRLAKGGTVAATERVTSTVLERVVSIDGIASDGRSAPANDPGFDLSCDKCASLASLSAMLHGDTFRLSLQEGRDVQVAALAWSSAERILRLGYLSRPTDGRLTSEATAAVPVADTATRWMRAAAPARATHRRRDLPCSR